MSENVIARGERTAKEVPFKKIIRIAAIVAAAILVIGLISSISDAAEMVKNHKHTKYCYKYSYRGDFYEDSADNDLKSYKMDCDYADGAFGMGLSKYFNGGIILPLLILGGSVAAAYVMRARNRSYVLTVTEDTMKVAYSDEKTLEIPLCSVFSVEKIGEKDLSIVTSENAYTLRDMENCNEVYTAVINQMPKINVKGPTNNEQVLAKGYPPAIKPVLLVLTILLAVASVILTIASEEFGVLLICAIPVGLMFLFYMLAKTPYLVVTDKRVFYVSDFGRKLSIPMNKVTVTVTHWFFRQLHIGAPAGRIHLFWVRNTAELYDTITAVQNEIQ